MRLFRFPISTCSKLSSRRLYHSEKGVYGHRPKSIFNEEIGDKVHSKRNEYPNFYRLVTAFRENGHRQAQINPLHTNVNQLPELSHERFGLTGAENVEKGDILYNESLPKSFTVKEGVEFLQKTYSSHIGYEFSYIEDEYEKDWFAKEIEQLDKEVLSNEYKKEIALEMTKSQNFDHFLANKFPTVKRYGGEGCESVMAFFLELINSSANLGVDHIVAGMAHRGRLNLLTGILKFPPVRMFQKMKGMPEFPPDARASGDVLSHLATSVDLKAGGKTVHFSLLPNPSHLEAVNPMAAGKARGKQKSLSDYDYSTSDSNDSSRVLCLQIHGDAALSAQGINQETLGFAYVPHFNVSGSMHLVINNQLGFTTPQERGRSSRYTTDIAKIIGAPVIHVNGDFPEEVAKATRLALKYRQKFQKDIFFDLLCFRRWGHNEMDDPTFTNPIIYKLIHQRKSIPDCFNERLINEGVLTEGEIKDSIAAHNEYLNENMSRINSYVPPPTYLENQWSGIGQSSDAITTWDTGIEESLLKYIGVKSVEFPQDFGIHPHLLKTYVKSRIAKITSGTKIDWATAEALALGSLLYQGFGVRFSGEDVGRGTFSQRHAMLVDQSTGSIHIPLNSAFEDQKTFLELANTTLSEEAVLAFEYGFSLEHKNNLVIWEAQFGDFFNGAQIQIDTMVASGETKWMLQSGLVMLLPHGMDGAGPEHSSCRIERFLQLTDSNENDKADGDYNNFQFANPTTPAQYFHLLRRQMIRDFRKPLVVAAPKVLLRLPEATSSLSDMEPSTSFLPIIGDSNAKPNDVKRLIFVSGKHYYNLKQKQEEMKRGDVALIRIESLCPFPVLEIRAEVEKYKNAKNIIWSQEEHQNMGAWSFIKPRFENMIGRKITYCGRGPLAAPAVGVGKVHHQEVKKILEEPFTI